MKFSIITCTCDSERFLPRNIDSVKKQNFLDFEHIFIDGFSQDRTVELIKNYQNRNPSRVKFFQLPPRGISNAMNKGIKKSLGDYLIHLHSDDSFFDNEVLADVDRFLSGKDLDWIYGKINVIDSQDDSIGIFPQRKIWQNSSKNFLGRYLLKFFNYIPHQAVFIRKEIFTKFGYFDETISSAMDPDLWLRIKDSANWRFFDRIISNYRIHNKAKSSAVENRIKNKQNFQIVQKRYLNKVEMIFARLINFCIDYKNKNLR